MAAIAGIVHFDGAPVDRERLQKMAEAMRYRSPDGIKVWCEGPVGLAHGHFWTTPEDVGEEQPISSQDGRYWITADARIDNRDELIPGLREFLDKQVPTDAEVILAAYQKWGTEAPRRLVGDFAFAVWDERDRSLFAARDVMGIRQFCYALLGGSLYFGTTVGAVVAGLIGSPRLNRGFMEDFIRADYSRWVCETVYADVRRLPPAHRLVCRQGKAGIELYYALGAESAPPCKSDAEWVEAFKALFGRAVRGCLRSRTRVGIVTGGGVDSASVACVAHDLRQRDGDAPDLALYGAVFRRTPDADESEYFRILARHCAGAKSVGVVGDDCWALCEFGGDNGYPLDEPEVMTTRGLALAVLRAAAGDGCDVVLGGEGGNEVGAQPACYDPSALRGVGWWDWWREARLFHRNTGCGWMELLLRAYVRPWLPKPLPAWIHALIPKRERPLRWLREFEPPYQANPCHLDHRFRQPTGLSFTSQVAYTFLRAGFLLARLAAYDVMAAYSGVEWRFPFFDRRVVEFALHVPRRLQCWRGRDRVLLRESMRDILPESIRTRSSKAHMLGLQHRGLRHREVPRIESLLRRSSIAAQGLVDADLLLAEFRSYWRGDIRGWDRLLMPLCLEAWFRHAEGRPGR